MRPIAGRREGLYVVMTVGGGSIAITTHGAKASVTGRALYMKKAAGVE
jgi:hypothetical protein